MWFKGLSFLSYTALLVAPTNAAFRGRGGVIQNGRNPPSARRHDIHYLQRRQQPWKNETRPSVVPEEPQSTILEPIVIVTSDSQIISTEIPEVVPSSTIVIKEPIPTTTPTIETHLPTSTAPPVENPTSSSSITPPAGSSSAAVKPVVSDPIVEQPSAISAVPSSSSGVESTQKPVPSTAVIPASEQIKISSAPILTSESILPTFQEPQPSTTAPPPTPSSTQVPNPVEEPHSTQLIPSIVQPSSTSINVAPEPTQIQTVIPEPQQPKPSSQQQASTTAEQQPSTTSVQRLSTASAKKPSVLEPEPSSTSEQFSGLISTTISPANTQVPIFSGQIPESTSTVLAPVESGSASVSSTIQSPSSTVLPQPPNVISTQDDASQGPVTTIVAGPQGSPSESSSTSSLVVPTPSLTPEGPIVKISTGVQASDKPTPSTAVITPITTNDLLGTPLPSGTGFLPVPSIILSGTSSIAISSVSQTGVNGSPSSIYSGAQPISSTTGGELPSVLPKTSTATIAIPKSEGNSILSSTATELPLPLPTDTLVSTGISLIGSVPTGITASESIPTSELLLLPTDVPTISVLNSNLISSQTGISFPSVAGTGLVPVVSSLVSSQVSQGNPTVSIDDSSTKGPLTTLAPASRSSIASLSVSFDFFNTSPSSSASQTHQPASTGIPTSETRSNPTTVLTGLPSTGPPTLLPTTAEISGSSNGSAIASSGFIGSGISAQTPITTGQPRQTEVAIQETSAEPIPTSDSVASTSLIDAEDFHSSSISSSSIGLSDSSVQPSGTSTPLTGDEGLTSTTLPSDHGGLVPSTTISAGEVESTTVPAPTSSTTAPAAAAPPPPPLSKSQTAGIAIGSTTCLLIALVAALFVARRYHTKAAEKRKSNGVYPEVAYLYDPPRGDGDAEAGDGVPVMSGGASGNGALAVGPPRNGPYGAVPMNSPGHSISSVWPADNQEPSPQNPFRDPASPFTHAAHNGAYHGPTDSTVSAWPASGVQEPSWRVPVLSPVIIPKTSFGNLANYGRTDSTVSAWPAGNQNRSSQDLALSPAVIPKSSFQNLPKHNSNESTVSAWPHNPKHISVSKANPFLDPVAAEPRLSTRPIAHSGSVSDLMGEYVSLAINPYELNPHAAKYPPMSPYVTAFQAAADASTVRESDRYSDPFADPFEHDLLLNVDVRSETPDSITVLAPPPTPRSPNAQGRYIPSPGPVSVSSSTLFPISRVPVGGHSSPNGRLTPPGRYTPTPELAHSGLSTLNNSPVTGPMQTPTTVPMHKGWENIKSNDSIAVPAPLNLAHTIKKKPIPIRRQPTLAGAGQVLLQGPGLPLILKRKEVGTHNKNGSTGSGFGLEVPSMYIGSPGPTINDFSHDLNSQRMRSGELMFADPKLVGKNF